MSREEEYPLYPELPEGAVVQAQELINKFKEEMKKVSEEVISDFYCDVVDYIETDEWTNFRNKMMDGFRDYSNKGKHGDFDFKIIRESILKEHREDIIKDLNQDMVGEVSNLKKEVERLRSDLTASYRRGY